MSEDQVAALLEAAFEILETIGMGDVPADLSEAALRHGAQAGADGRIRFPRGMARQVLSQAAPRLVLHGRAEGRDLAIGDDRVWFGTGGAAVQTLDLDTGRYRPSTLSDLADLTRIADRLDNIAWFTRPCIGTDVADAFQLELNTARLLMKYTAKPVGMSFTLPDHVDPIADLFCMVAGSEEAFRAAPFVQVHISPVISPLKFGADAVAVTRACIRRGLPVNTIIAAQAGATAPATPAGMLAQSTAETIAALLMVNLFAPGHPCIFSNWPFVIDLRSGAFAGSGGEISVMNAAAAQLGNRLGLPTGVAAAMADAKAVDAQMGAEKAASALAAGLSGANMVFEAAGMMASLMGVSAAAMVADDEMLGMVNRILRGVEVTPDSIGLKTITDAVRGEGHFLGAAQTLAAMERDYLYPALGDRSSPGMWEEAGAPTLADRAAERAREILATHRPNHLGPAEREIQARFGDFLIDL